MVPLRSSKRRLLLLGAVGLVAAAIVLGTMVAGNDGSKRPGPSPSTFVTVSHSSDLAVLELATGRIRLLTDSRRRFIAVSSPSWSPDGHRIVVGRQQCRSCPFGLAVASLDGGTLQPVRGLREEANEPAWSPTGRSVAFSTSGDEERKIVLFDLRTARGRELETHEEEAGAEPEEEVEAPNHPAFSADGRMIAFDAEATRERSRIFVFDLADGGLHEIESEADHNAYPAFSSLGGRLAFSQTDASGAWDVCVTRLGTTRGDCLTSGPANDTEPSWFPDGRSLVFASDRDDPGRLIRSLFLIELDGSGLHRLTQGFDDGAPAVSPDGTKVAFVRRHIERIER